MTSWMLAAGIAWLTLSPLLASVSDHVSERPPSDAPTQVHAGLYYIDISEINGATETYTATAYLALQWTDPRLRFASQDEDQVVLYHPEEIWTPSVEIINAQKVDDQIPAMCTVTSDGTVYFVRRVVVLLNTQMDLRRFPFDRQNLNFIIETSSRYGSSKLVFLPDPDQSGLGKDIVSRGWSYDPLTWQVVDQPFANTQQTYSRMIFTFAAKRNAEYFIWKIIFPTIVFVLLTWTVFWMPVHEVQTALLVSITVLLTAVAFGNLTDALLPQLGYRTWLDQFQLGSFLFMVSTVVEIVTVYGVHRRGDTTRAEKVRTFLRIFYPGAYAFFCLVLLLIVMLSF
jgi:hypothetical protein